MTETATGTTITPDAIQKVLVEALSQVLGREIGEVGASTSLFAEIGLDSTGVLDLLMILEEELDLELEMENLEMSDFETIGTLTEFLHRAQGED